MADKKQDGNAEGLDIWDIALPVAGAAIPYLATRGRARKLGRKWVESVEASRKDPKNKALRRGALEAGQAADAYRGLRLSLMAAGGAVGTVPAAYKNQKRNRK